LKEDGGKHEAMERTTTQPTQQVERRARATMTEREFAKAVGLSVTTLWALRRAGKLPHFKVGRRILYCQDHVREFLASIEQNPKAA
jgi:excisionase family DNA binding protein